MDKPTNTSLEPEDEEGEGSGRKFKLLIYGGGLLLIVAFLIWAIVGTASWSSCGTDLENQKSEFDRTLSKLRQLNIKLEEKVANLTIEVGTLKQDKKKLESVVDLQADEIQRLRTQVALKEVEIEKLKVQLKQQEETIKTLKKTIEEQAMQIDNLNDNLDEYFSDLRMVVGILNQELNRNQALAREIERLTSEKNECQNSIAPLRKEIDNLKEKVLQVTRDKQMIWLSRSILEHFTSSKVSLTQVYNGNEGHCNSKAFYEKIKDIQPNVFIATERGSDLSFGGMTGENWTTKEGSWKADPYAFTFSLTNEATCTLKEELREHAINTNRTVNGQDVLLTFGEDISIGTNCIEGLTHTIAPNKVYDCPNIGPPYFYTTSASPRLLSFAFYRAEILPTH